MPLVIVCKLYVLCHRQIVCRLHTISSDFGLFEQLGLMKLLYYGELTICSNLYPDGLLSVQITAVVSTSATSIISNGNQCYLVSTRFGFFTSLLLRLS